VAVTLYTVTAEKSGKWWVLQCTEVPGAVSQTARLDQAEDIIREAILWVAGVPETEIEIDVRVVLPVVVRESINAAERFRRESAEATIKASLAVSAAARELHRIGLTVRDIGTVLGVSHEHAGQLVDSAAKES
jgi:predicted RNase H-like HicB family nuclease